MSEYRFGSDHGALRSEDEPLLTGGGRFTDDLNVPGQAYGVFVRAPVGHAAIRAIDVRGGAARCPGVLGVFTGQDAAADGLGAIPPVRSFPGRDGKPMFAAAMPVLAQDRVRYVGEPVAIVVAETSGQAQDAAEAVRIDLDDCRARSDIERAPRAGCAGRSHAARPGQRRARLDRRRRRRGRRAFAQAAHVERVRLHDTRLAPVRRWSRAAASASSIRRPGATR